MAETEQTAARILVVDDEERIRDACSMVLEDEGYLVESADSGELGLQMIEERHFDVILLDLMMPAISGLELLPKLIEDHPDTAVIVITGYATVEHSIEAMKKGAFDFIPKPFSPEQLRTIVAKSIKYTQALQDISDSRSRLRLLVNRLRDGVMTTDCNKRIVLVNPAFLDMVGFSGGVVNGMKVEEVVASQDLVQMIDETLSMPDDTIAETVREIAFSKEDDQEELYASASCSPFRSRTGQVLGSTTVLHDITAAREMDRMKSDFVSMVSHEIKSPMNSLLAQIKIILDGLAGEVSVKQREILERAQGKVNNLIKLASELLDLARIEAGLVGGNREEVDLGYLLRDQVEFYRPAARQKNIQLLQELSASLSSIEADRQGMEEVITNLLSNGIKYSPEGGTITVSAVEEDDFLVVRVSDTGYGIPEEDLAAIFNRFHRVKDNNTRDIHGTGLGLAIVKSIIDAHQGTIRVESVLEQGTTFTVMLPLP